METLIQLLPHLLPHICEQNVTCSVINLVHMSDVTAWLESVKECDDVSVKNVKNDEWTFFNDVSICSTKESPVQFYRDES